jgi:site-specific recombinase XerD
MIMLLLDTGARRAELVDLKLAHVDLDLEVLLVLGKGCRERALPFATRPVPPWTATFAPGLATRTPRSPGYGLGCRAG